MKNIYRLLFLFVLFSCVQVQAGFCTDTDSLKAKKPNRSHWRLTTRLHSEGIFTYGGRMGTDNPSFDVNFTYERPQWGLLVFKGLDIVDRSTDYNFALVTIFKNFKLSKKLTFTPSIGSFLEQSTGVADKGSDVACILVASYKVGPHASIEYMSLFGNLVLGTFQKDWVSRVRLLYSYDHWDVTPSLWRNNNVFDTSNYWSAGINVAYSRIKIADHFFLSAGVTGLVMMQTSDETENPKKNGLMFTLALQVVH